MTKITRINRKVAKLVLATSESFEALATSNEKNQQILKYIIDSAGEFAKGFDEDLLVELVEYCYRQNADCYYLGVRYLDEEIDEYDVNDFNVYELKKEY